MAQSPKVDVLCLGDELLLGIRDNTHLTYLGGLLGRHGLTLRRNEVVRDVPGEIVEAFRRAWATADLIITTGGLGPTQDDLTKESIAEALGLQLHLDPASEAAIRERFARMGRVPTPSNWRQAYLLTGAEAIPNRYGTAPGQWLHRDGKRLILLPGPTNELVPMFEEQVLPRLQREGVATPGEAYLQIRVCGLGESNTEALLQPIFDKHRAGLGVAFCVHNGLVDVRLSAVPGGGLGPADLRHVGEHCRLALGENFVCFGDCDLATLVFHRVRALGSTLAVAESCTGGLLSNAFTDIPGASKVFLGGLVCYANDAKIQLLDVPEAIIQQHGAVSAECAIAMATGAAEKFGSDYALAVTGFAGPGGGTAENPVGTIYLGYYSPVGVWSHKAVYNGSRLQVKARAVNLALDWMRRKLNKHAVDEFLHCCTSC